MAGQSRARKQFTGTGNALAVEVVHRPGAKPGSSKCRLPIIVNGPGFHNAVSREFQAASYGMPTIQPGGLPQQPIALSPIASGVPAPSSDAVDRTRVGPSRIPFAVFQKCLASDPAPVVQLPGGIGTE